MLCQSGCHHWRDRLPMSLRSGASRWFRLWQGLAEPAMWQRQMRRSQRQPQLSLTPREVFGEAVGTPCEATIALTLRQGGAFNIAGVHGCAGWQEGQLLCHRLRITADHCAVHLHDTAMGSCLHTLGIPQPRWRAGAVVWDSILDSRYTASWEAQHTIIRHKLNPPLGYLYERPPA